MRLLTQQEAQLVLQEAYRLKAEYANAKSRIGQSMHWTASLDSKLPFGLVCRLANLLEDKQAEGIDFYHWADDNKVIQCFYEHFVEQK